MASQRFRGRLSNTRFRAQCQRSGSTVLPMRWRKNRANPHRRRFHPTRRVGATIASSVSMLVTAERLEIARSTQSLAPQYASLIRLAEAIRSHRDQRDLFQVLADELHQVIPFDAMCQCDPTGNKVNWHFSEGYDSDDCRISDIPKEETVGWWGKSTKKKK